MKIFKFNCELIAYHIDHPTSFDIVDRYNGIYCSLMKYKLFNEYTSTYYLRLNESYNDIYLIPALFIIAKNMLKIIHYDIRNLNNIKKNKLFVNCVALNILMTFALYIAYLLWLDRF